MKLIYDCHTHTNYSHGKNTAREMIDRAHEIGLCGIHITEHGYMHYHSKKHLTTAETHLRLRDEVEKCKSIYPAMDICFGVEANVINLDGEIDVPQSFDGIYDFINVGYHMMVVMTDIKSEFKLQGNVLIYKKLGVVSLEPKFSEICTETMLKTLDNYNINMITHPTRSYPMDMERIAKKCEETNTLLEINDPKGLLNADQVRKVLKVSDKVNFAVGSDAHCVENVGKCETAFKIIKESGVDIKRVVNVEE